MGFPITDLWFAAGEIVGTGVTLSDIRLIVTREYDTRGLGHRDRILIDATHDGHGASPLFGDSGGFAPVIDVSLRDGRGPYGHPITTARCRRCCITRASFAMGDFGTSHLTMEAFAAPEIDAAACEVAVAALHS